MLTLDDVKRIRKNAGVDNSNANKNYIFTKNTPKIKLNDEALSKTFGIKTPTKDKNSYEEKIKELGREDKIDYYSDLWDLQSDLSNKSKYTKKDYGRKKPTAEEYYNDLINAKENRNILEEAGIKMNQLGERLGSALLGYGEGNGAGGLVKLTQNQLIKSDAYRQAVSDYKDGLISEDEISKRTKEYEKDAEENLSSATENINTMYESLGNHQVARNIGNIAGTIGGGVTMTSLGAPAPLVYGGQSALKKYGETDDLGDVAFAGAKGAVYGIINNKIGNAVSQTIGKLFPKTASNIVANIAKNFITGGASVYGANALTGEAENIYNKARNRKVTKEDWTNPIWSNETLTNFVIGGIIGGVTGTARDIKNAKVEAQRIGKELVKYLEKSAKSMKEAAQKGDLETARNINKQAQVVIEEFSNKTLLVYRLNENTKNLLINLWANEANEASILYNPTALNDGTNNVSTASSTNIPYMQGISGFISDSNKATPSIGQISSNTTNNVNVPQGVGKNVSELLQNVNNTIQDKSYIPTNKTQNSMPNNANIQGLEDYTEQDIKDIVSDYIQDLNIGVKIKDMALNGSRIRGDSKTTSDLDVVVEYEGDIAEDSLFNELNKEPLVIDGIKVDINPITKGKSGTLEEYMKKSKAYDEQQNLTKNNANMNDMNFNYNERPKNALQQAQLDKIRENISDIINNINVEDGIFVTNSESRASADANYIEVYNEKTDESKTIRVANHYKDGVSGEADYNIYIDEFDDMNRLNVAIEDTIDKAMQSISTPEQEDLPTDDMVFEPQGNYNVEKSQQSLYNQERGGISGKEQRKTNSTLSGNKNESKSDRRDIGNVQYREITNESDIEHRDFSKNWNADNRRKNITYNNEREESGKQRKLIDDAVIEKAFKDVINKYGRTTEYKSAGYLLPDGTMTNLTDKATGRRIPHADVRFTGLDELDFIYSGAIRLFPEFGYWSMTENPTQEQLDILEEYIDKYVHESLKLPAGFEEHDTFVDVYTKNGKIETFQISRYENGNTAIKQLKVFLNSIKKNSKQSSFSLSKDNQGRTLSKEQQEYFKDSKVRDEKGNLKVMYHGTDADFNTFSYDYLGKTGLAYGEGFYFTDNAEAGQSYGKNLKQVYLDVKKPMQAGLITMTRNDYSKLVKELNEITNGTIEADYGSLEDAISEYDYGGDDIDLISAAQNISGISFERFYNILRNILGYDGIIANNKTNGHDGNIIIVFNSNQIKSVDNTKPTSNPDILKEPSEEYEYTTEKDKLHLERAEETFGCTNSFQKAGFLTYEGKLLDFSDGSNRRIEDHRAIMQVFDEDFESNTDYLVKFMNEGNIRISPEVPGIEISNFSEPSNAQLDMIEQYAEKNKYSGYFVVDFCNEYGDNIGSLEYEDYIDPAQIVEDVEEYFRTGELPIVNESSTEYNEQAKNEMPIKVLKSTDSILKPQVVGQRIWEGFKKQGYIDLNGKTVKNVQDVAELAQIFRNPKYETFRVIYTNGNTIVGQEAVTSYLPGISKVSVEKDIAKIYYKMQDRMKRLNANGYYLVHNHPAGTAKASLSDIKTTENISENVKGFKGHVVVDHGTYAFISKDDFGMRWQNEIKVDDKNALYKGSQFETKLLSNKIPWNNIKINNRSDFASLMYNLKNSTDYSTLVLCDAKKSINAIIDVPNKFFNMRLPHVEGYIKNVSKKYGAVDAFVGTSSEDAFNKIKQLTNLRDIVLYQDNTEKFGEEKGNSVFNYKNTFGMRTAEETQEERKERVQKYIEEMQETIGTLGAKVDRKAIVDKIVNEYGIVQKGNSKELNRVSKEIQNLIEQGALTDSKIENYAEELIDNLRITVNDYYNANKELKELIRRTKLYASDTVKNGFGQWEEFRKQNIGTLRLTNDTEALPVDTFYKELTEMYGESIFPSDIANTSDQLEKISEVAKSIKKIDQTLRENIEENFGEEAREEIVKGLVENLKTLREKAKQSSFTNEEVPPDTEIKKRSWTKTVRKNDMVSTFLDIKDMKYVVKGNKGTVARANDILESEGYENSLKHFESIVESGKFPTVDEIALGERLIQESIKLGKFEKATELVSDVSILGTELGQSVQAMSIIHRLSPTGQLMHLKRAVDRINKKQMGKGSSTSKLPKEIRKNSKLKEMIDKIVTGEQSKLKLKEEMQGNFDVNDIIDKIEKGEQEKIELPKEIKDNSDLMELITKIEKGEQTKIELQKETKSNTELGKIVTKVIDGEQTKIDLGITDEAISEKKKFKKGKIELTPEMELAILCSQTPEELEIAVTRVKEQLAIQMPVSFGDKLQAWRYLAMLGNPVTHIGNVLGNTTMKILYSRKNVTQRALETIFDDKLEERTRTFERATKDVKNFAEQMLMDNKDTLMGNGYSNIQSELMSMRRIFKTKWLEWARKKVSNALSIEDFWAKKGVFKKALAEYLTANGIKTNQDIKNNQELVQKGINFAIEEALKATFNQYNKVASALNKFENTNELTKIAIGGTAPFKKTPMNITKTSVQYNSLGLAETLLIETKRLKEDEITGNEYIERISQGLTGTEIMILGMWLASLGIISASGGSKEDKHKESIGMFRPYSINIGEIHIDITWLSPAAVPLLMGAEVYENMKGKDKSVWERILDGGEALSKVLNPIAETTMLSSLNDALSNYGGELSYDALGEVIKSIISSYIGQAFPTLGGRINRLIDPTIRSTAVSKNSKASFLEGIIRTNINKIPGLSYLLEPSIDIWGNVKKRSDYAVVRGLDAFVNRASITIDESTKVDEEILRVYHVNENEKVLPKTRVNKYFTSKSVKYEMSAKEYTQFKMDYGQTAYSKLEELFSTKEYLQMNDAEKEKAIEEAYDIATDIAKYRYMTDKYGEEGLKKILDDNTYRKYTNVKKIANLNYEEYLEAYYSRKGIEADKNKKRRNYKRFKV